VFTVYKVRETLHDNGEEGVERAYGNNVRLDRGDSLIVHPSENGRVVTLEYEVHGKVLATDTPYDNRFVSIATIENRKIVRWRDYMDSLAAWRALNRVT
jgi:uncharacterized protein